jgi:hypothetical protein
VDIGQIQAAETPDFRTDRAERREQFSPALWRNIDAQDIGPEIGTRRATRAFGRREEQQGNNRLRGRLRRLALPGHALKEGHGLSLEHGPHPAELSHRVRVFIDAEIDGRHCHGNQGWRQ